MRTKEIGFESLLQPTTPEKETEKSKDLKSLTIHLPKELHKELRIEAANRNTTIREIVIMAIEKELK